MKKESDFPVWSNKTQEGIDRVQKLGEDLLRAYDEFEERCGDCLFFETLKDPKLPELNICLCNDVLKLGMQPEPHEDFGCKFFMYKLEGE